MKAQNEGRRYALVAAALLGFVIVLLAGGYALAQRSRTAGPAVPSILVAQSAPAKPATAAPLNTASPGGSPIATASPSGSSQPESEVVAAYLRYWQVYSDAVLNLDTSHLSEVLAGQALQLVTQEVAGLKQQNTPAHIEVQHSYAVVQLTDSTATLVDDYTSRSVYLDPNTKQPLSRTDPPSHVEQTFQFQKLDGVWKIVNGTREVQSAQP